MRTFKNRTQLNWFQLIIVLIFLNALMTIPVTINYAKMDIFPLEEFYPNAVQLLDQEVVDALEEVDYEEGFLSFNTPFVFQNEYGLVAGGIEAMENLENENLTNSILFEENQFIISEEGLPTTTVLYTKDFSLENVRTVESLREETGRQWFTQNRILIVLIFSLMISGFFLMMSLLLVGGAALFIYLTKKSSLTSVVTYKESVNFILNILAIPTLLAMGISLIHFDVIMMVTVQSVGLIAMLLLVYHKTHFKD